MGAIRGIPVIVYAQNKELYYDIDEKILGYLKGTIISFMGSEEFIIDHNSFDELMPKLFKFNMYETLVDLIYQNNNILKDIAFLDNTCDYMTNSKLLKIINDITPDIIKYIKKELSDDTLPDRLSGDIFIHTIFCNTRKMYQEMDNFLIKIYKNVLQMIINKYKEGK